MVGDRSSIDNKGSIRDRLCKPAKPESETTPDMGQDLLVSRRDEMKRILGDLKDEADMLQGQLRDIEIRIRRNNVHGSITEELIESYNQCIEEIDQKVHDMMNKPHSEGGPKTCEFGIKQ